MKKLILIDGYSFLFRAFFAIRNLTRKDGTPVGGLYGFSRMLIKIITEIEYTHIAVVFDSGEKTFRNEIYSEYKATRPPCPPELLPQFPLVRDLVKVLNIVSLEKVGYEADDIIATYAKKAEKEDFDVVIVSSDKDLMQLVDDKVLMFDGLKNEFIDTEKVKEKWGVEPKKVLDVLTLMGDASDNVPGVAGIGQKTAIELINQYGDVENLMKHLDEIKQNKRRETLKNSINEIKLSKKLITLDENVEINYTLDDLKFKQYDYKKFLDFLTQQEFYSMVRGLKQAFATVEPSINDNENIVIANDLFAFNNQNTKEDNKNVGNIKIKNIEELKSIIKNNKNIEKFYFNIFTEKDNFLSFTFKFDKDCSYYIKISNTQNDLFTTNKEELIFKDIVESFKNIFENSSILKISYDVKKQIKILYQYGILIENFEDIDVMNYILNNGLYSNTLSSICKHNLDDNFDNQENKLSFDDKIDIISKIERENKIDNLDDSLKELSYFIVDSFYILYNKFKQDLDNDEELNNIYNRIEKPMTLILAKMEITGIKVDIKRLYELSNEFQTYIDKLSKEIYEIAGEEFNIASPKQLSNILFDKLQLNHGKKSSKTGHFSTGIEVLEELAGQGSEICQKILSWRHYSKLKNTYTDVLPKMVDKNSRIHTTYSNTFVITGRLSSSNPNLQNIPIKTDDGSKIRSAFVAKEGCKLISADYKQAELRIIANLHNVEKLKEFFLAGKDIHTTTASNVFKVDEKEVSSSMRSIAKAINFSIIYGTSAYGLAKRTNSSNDDAKKYLYNYFQTYPEIKNYIEYMKDYVKKHNYVKTIFGRKINIDIASARPIMRGNLERLAINAPIQGTAADIIKKAMIDLDEKLKNYRSKMILQIHDELVLECPENEVEEISRILKESMENVIDWEVKMEVDVESGNNLEEV